MEPKMPYLGILARKFEKLLLYLRNQYPWICQNSKTSSKQKKANLGPKIPYLAILGCKFEKVLIYLWSVPSNLSNCKVSCNNKNL